MLNKIYEQVVKNVNKDTNLEVPNLQETKNSLSLFQKIELAKFFLTYDFPIIKNKDLKFDEDEEEYFKQLLIEVDYEAKNYGYFRESSEFETQEDWLTDMSYYIDKVEYSNGYSKLVEAYN